MTRRIATLSLAIAFLLASAIGALYAGLHDFDAKSRQCEHGVVTDRDGMRCKEVGP